MPPRHCGGFFLPKNLKVALNDSTPAFWDRGYFLYGTAEISGLWFAVAFAGEKFLTGAGVETYLSIEGLAKYLDIAEKTVRKWVLNRDIPYHKIMKVIRFRVSEIEQWVETSGKFPPADNDGGQGGDLFAEDEAGYEAGRGEDSKGIEAAETGGEA
jgi:excisionase family DNA binding protein